MTVAESSKLLTTGDVAEQAGVTRTTVLHWIKSGKLRATITTAGGHYRVRQVDLSRFLREHKGTDVAAPEKPRILVVDDDPMVLDTVVRILRPALPDCQFETAADGIDAGMKLLRFLPTLLVLDLMLPGIDGFEVCRLVRSDPQLKDIAILCITGYNRPGMYEQAVAAGADDCLFKPLEIQTLRRRVKELLGLPAE